MAKSKFAEAMRTEIAGLETELTRDVRYIRLRELRKLLSLYGEDDSYSNVKEPTVATAAPSAKRVRQSPRQTSPQRDNALSAVREFVISRKDVVPTRDILTHLLSIGINVSGAKPLNNLSAIISTSGEFEAHGRSGWTLLERDDPHDQDLMRDEGSVRSVNG